MASAVAPQQVDHFKPNSGIVAVVKVLVCISRQAEKPVDHLLPLSIGRIVKVLACSARAVPVTSRNARAGGRHRTGAKAECRSRNFAAASLSMNLSFQPGMSIPSAYGTTKAARGIPSTEPLPSPDPAQRPHQAMRVNTQHAVVHAVEFRLCVTSSACRRNRLPTLEARESSAPTPGQAGLAMRDRSRVPVGFARRQPCPGGSIMRRQPLASFV